MNTQSLVYPSSPEGIATEPRRFTTYDAADAFIARTMPHDRPQVVFANHSQSTSLGRQNVYVYTGGDDGYRPDRRIELPGHSAAEIIPCDFNQDGVCGGADETLFFENEYDLNDDGQFGAADIRIFMESAERFECMNGFPD